MCQDEVNKTFAYDTELLIIIETVEIKRRNIDQIMMFSRVIQILILVWYKLIGNWKYTIKIKQTVEFNKR